MALPVKQGKKEILLAKTTSFDKEPAVYDSWYDRRKAEYESEIEAVRALVPSDGMGVEIGVGTGRFAAPLDVRIGVDPSIPMLLYAAKRDTIVVAGAAEALPFRDGMFDFALMVTTLCVVDDAKLSVAEAYRVIKRGGCFVLGFLDSASRFGKEYVRQCAHSPFCSGGRFHSAVEIDTALIEAGFKQFSYVQTLFRPLEESRKVEPYRQGYGDGLFVVARAFKQ